jgi:hypothetical protein
VSNPVTVEHLRVTQTVYVVDSDGRTFVFRDQKDAEAGLIREAYDHAPHLTITKAEAPAELSGEALVDWCIANVPPITCNAQ